MGQQALDGDKPLATILGLEATKLNARSLAESYLGKKLEAMSVR